MTNKSIYDAFERFWQYVIVTVGDKAERQHSHDDIYYTKAEIDNKLANAGGGGTGGMVVSGALLSPGYTVMDSISLSVEIEEQEET